MMSCFWFWFFASSWGPEFWNERVPTLDALKEELSADWEEAEMQRKGFANEQEEEAFFRARAARAESRRVATAQ